MRAGPKFRPKLSLSNQNNITAAYISNCFLDCNRPPSLQKHTVSFLLGGGVKYEKKILAYRKREKNFVFGG
jgi:hypothetical protein